MTASAAQEKYCHSDNGGVYGSAYHFPMPRKSNKKPEKRHPGHYIREWRESLELSQEAVAERVGLSIPQVSKIENGRQGYRQNTLELFAKAFKRAPADLLRPPNADESDLGLYITMLPDKRRKRALKVLKAILADEAADEDDLADTVA